MDKITTQRVDPGASRSTRIDWNSVAADARAAAGEWVRLDDLVNTGYVWQIKKGLIRAFQPAGTFDATTRRKNKIREGCAELYVRLVVPASAEGEGEDV